MIDLLVMRGGWEHTLRILEKSLHQGLFQVWIKPLEGRYEDGRLTLLAPNEFVASWVRDRLKNAILEAATQAMGQEPRLEIQVKTRQPREPEAQPAARSGMEPRSERCPAMLRPLAGGNGKAHEMALPGLSVTPAPPPTWRFSFDDFVVGPSNEMAYAASQGLCRDALVTDQLFIASQTGLGKTHLVHAIGRRLACDSNRGNPRLACLTAEEFCTRLVMAIKAKEVERFKAMFREHLDVLLLEDIHFLQGKQKMQDELLATLKALQGRGCRVVLSSSFLPRELKDVDDHLASLLCSGFLACIEHPDFETRRRILQSKAGLHRVSLPDHVADMLADNLTSDVRQLESCLQNLLLKARLLNRRIDAALVREVLAHYAKPEDRGIGLESIIDFICREFELSARQLRSKSRKRQIVLARNTAYYLARKHTDLCLKQIGSQFNRRHSTVIKGITNVEREINLGTPLGRQLRRTLDRLDA